MNAILALALALGVQDSPDEAFRKIEAAIEGARSIRVAFTIDASADDALPGKGSLTIEDGPRVRITAELNSKGRKSVPLSVDCDGRKIRSAFDQSKIEVSADPKAARSNYNVYLSRLGIFTGAMFDHGFWAGSSARGREAMTIDLKQVFQVQNLQSSGDGKGGSKILTYDYKSAFEPMPFKRAKIWYDPRSYKLLRRECQWVFKDKMETIIEDYTELLFDDEKAGVTPAKPEPPPPVSDAEMDNLFFKAKLQVAESHLRAGKKDKAAEILEEIIKTYPKHPQIADARRLLEDARRK